MKLIIILIISILANFIQLGGEIQSVVEENAYTYVTLSDSASIEAYEYTPDSVLVVMTACAPKCSSCARIYNKEGEVTQTITPPFTSIFPAATIDKKTGELIWTDNDDWEY